MIIKDRINKTIEQFGEDFLINGTTPAKGFFQLFDQVRLNMYFDSIEQSSITRPALVLMVSGDTQAAVNNTIGRDGRTYTVKKMSNLRAKNEIVMKFLALV